MDAISFVLGIKSSHLRSAHLKDLVYRGRVLKTSKINDDGSVDTNGHANGFDDGDDKASRGDPKTAWVMAVRSITNQGASEYRINDPENILIKARNFLVFQGDVEAIASQSPHDLTRLIEQISGSLDHKADYERLQSESEQAAENQNFQLHRRRGINSEIKQYREQKKEADNFQKKTEERDAAILFHFQKDHQEDLKELKRNAARKEQAAAGQRSVEDRENDLVPVQEKIHELQSQVSKAEIVNKVKKDIDNVEKAREMKKQGQYNTLRAQVMAQNLERQRKADEVTVNNLRGKIEAELANIDERRSTADAASKELSKEIDSKKKEFNQLQSERLEEKLEDVARKLREADDGRRQNDKEARMKEMVTSLKRIYPGQKKFDEAVIVALVDTEKIGVECRFPPMTFIPLDNIKVNAVNTSVKGFSGARLTIDTINFDSVVERAMSYACGSSVHICYDKKIPVKAAGLMTGGRGPEQKADVQNLQKMAAKLKEEIERLPKADRRGSHEERLAAVRDELNAFDKNHGSKKRELDNQKRQLHDLQPKYDEQASQLEITKGTCQEYKDAIARVEDEVFANFCSRLGYSDIRAYDASQGKLEQEFEWEETRHNDTQARMSRMRTHSYTRDKKAIEKAMREEQDEVDALRETLDETRADLGEKNQKVAEARAEDINVLETTSALLRRCRLEQIQIPLVEGTLDNLPNEDDLLHQDPDAMDVDDDDEEIMGIALDDHGIEIDFDGLDEELKNSDAPSMEETLTDKITALTVELEKLNPNMRAMERLESVESRLKHTDQEYEDSKAAAHVAKEAFNEIKQRRFELFNKAFSHIQEQISHVYKDLTRSEAYPLGGQAYLDIEEDTDMPYLSGIKYHAMPPLKRFRDMEHLSGGEKTMAALALLFAIHSYQPSPFFVLDEVDAALDNANVDKIKKYIREHSGPGMQFIVISLKAGLFQDSESLVGVYRDQEVNSSRTLTLDCLPTYYIRRCFPSQQSFPPQSTLRDDDLAYLMSINTKDLHKICGKLREDRFLTVHTRSELREGNPRPSNRTWYYINYRNTIDAIKWRMYTIDKEVQGTTQTTNEKKEYFCSFCKAEWTAMEVLDSVGPEGFLCHRCHHSLTFEADRNAGGHEQSTRLNDQFKFISELLPKIDAVHIPECDFDRALAKARPVIRDATHQRAATIPVDNGANRPMAVKGLTNTGPQSIAVNISTSDGPSEAEKAAELARKERIAKQNALPSWMSNSTVTGESFSGSAEAIPSSMVKSSNQASSTIANQADNTAKAQIDDIFEQLKAEQAAGRAREAEDGDEFGSEEDEDDEFEDVPPTGNTSSRDTPATPALKREVSIDVTHERESSDERQAKRVKVEPEIKKEEAEEDSDEDDMEFEDDQDWFFFFFGRGEGWLRLRCSRYPTGREENRQVMRTPMNLHLPPIFLLPTRLQPEELHELEGKIDSLTYNIHEADIVLGNISRRERAMFELRRARLETIPLCKQVTAVAHTDRLHDTASIEEPSSSPSPKRRRLSDTGRSDNGTVQVVKLTWFKDSLEKGNVLPIEPYLLYEGKKLCPTATRMTTSPASPNTTKTPYASGVMERAAMDHTVQQTSPVPPSRTRHKGSSISSSPRSQRPPKLVHETTSEHDLALPPIPEFLKTTYSCQRPTPVNPPNDGFVEILKQIRTLRLLRGDQVGVRAYSTSIATVAAYPYPLKTPHGEMNRFCAYSTYEEVARLPGCGARIAELFEQWKETGYLSEIQKADSDAMISVLKLFYDIWGVGETTAREFYRKGWRDLDDLVEYGWNSLSRSQQIGTKYYDELKLKIPRVEVESIGATILDHARMIDPEFKMIIVGGFRRGKKESGDVDIILSHRDEDMTLRVVEKIVMSLEKAHLITHTLTLSTRNSERGQAPLPWRGEGTTKSGFDTLDKAMVIWKDPDEEDAPHRRVDIIVSPWKTVGCAVLGWSGGTTFQRDLRRYCKAEKGWKFDSSGIRNRADGAWIDLEGSTRGDKAADMETAERRVFEGLGLTWRPPEERCTG
ncbi:hypothetical protein BGZ63DRAFT_416080 [Mariannaea sp. PMI_226]|nr:hypothetical protein BGZ63DRAFT_416080 [Mariannaea sp. PMI_226]